jgi:hypothetical protein
LRSGNRHEAQRAPRRTRRSELMQTRYQVARMVARPQPDQGSQLENGGRGMASTIDPEAIAGSLSGRTSWKGLASLGVTGHPAFAMARSDSSLEIPEFATARCRATLQTHRSGIYRASRGPRAALRRERPEQR